MYLNPILYFLCALLENSWYGLLTGVVMRIRHVSLILLSVLLWVMSCSKPNYDEYVFHPGSSTETIGIEWVGMKTKAPENPDTNWTYFNTLDSVGYIWNRVSWDTIVVGDLNNLRMLHKIALCWKGAHSTPPQEAKVAWAYYDRGTRGSYIWDSTAWSILIKDVDPLSPLQWKGTAGKTPANPQTNWAYYDTTAQKSFIYDGTQWVYINRDTEALMIVQEPGTPLRWLGNLSVEPDTAKDNSIYYNASDSCSYIFSSGNWFLFCDRDEDCTFDNFKTMRAIWRSDLNDFPGNPEQNTLFYHGKFGPVLWNGEEWALVSLSREAYDFQWKGVLNSPVENPIENDAYFNLQDKRSYYFVGGTWKLLYPGKI